MVIFSSDLLTVSNIMFLSFPTVLCADNPDTGYNTML